MVGHTEVPARRAEEFYCDRGGGGCGKYFKTWLRRNMNGNFVILCPSCNHEHFRVIDDGLVTEERHSDRHNNAIERLQGLKATLSDTPWHNDPSYRRQQLALYSGGTRPS